jgi:hypothetical protein
LTECEGSVLDDAVLASKRENVVKGDGTRGDGLTISTYSHIKDAGNLPWAKPALTISFGLIMRVALNFFEERGEPA